MQQTTGVFPALLLTLSNMHSNTFELLYQADVQGFLTVLAAEKNCTLPVNRHYISFIIMNKVLGSN